MFSVKIKPFVKEFLFELLYNSNPGMSVGVLCEGMLK